MRSDDMKKLNLLVLLSALAVFPAQAGETKEIKAVVKIPQLTMELATKLAAHALKECRASSFQVAVTVVDRGGHPLVVMRDTLSPDITLVLSRQKAYTAMSFNLATSQLEPLYTKTFGVGKIEGVVFTAGGLPIESAGNIVGGIGVAGAPSGHDDEKCAEAAMSAAELELKAPVL
jgi:uncharacterized protein GlcG (DUF336 family)